MKYVVVIFYRLNILILLLSLGIELAIGENKSIPANPSYYVSLDTDSDLQLIFIIVESSPIDSGISVHSSDGARVDDENYLETVYGLNPDERDALRFSSYAALNRSEGAVIPRSTEKSNGDESMFGVERKDMAFLPLVALQIEKDGYSENGILEYKSPMDYLIKSKAALFKEEKGLDCLGVLNSALPDRLPDQFQYSTVYMLPRAFFT
ncbi:hypothetical protein ACH42_05970 [Endozoicomonas sp. (ex Bugula neritina AB1)]|nr:hypothetical protein ACH42_05970 [Endozoicomonas sp. (ex Bugula neritina AB1)]